jgi:hypothetical protein
MKKSLSISCIWWRLVFPWGGIRSSQHDFQENETLRFHWIGCQMNYCLTFMNRRQNGLNIELRAECQLRTLLALDYRQYWAICYVCRMKPKPTLYHVRNGFDRESNPRPQRWPALMFRTSILPLRHSDIPKGMFTWHFQTQEQHVYCAYIFFNQIQYFMIKINTFFAEWWSGPTSADQQGQNTWDREPCSPGSWEGPWMNRPMAIWIIM